MTVQPVGYLKLKVPSAVVNVSPERGVAEGLWEVDKGVADGDGAELVEAPGNGPFAAGGVASLLQADRTRARAAARMAAEETLWALMPRMLGGYHSTVLSQPSSPSTEIDMPDRATASAGEVQQTIPAA